MFGDIENTIKANTAVLKQLLEMIRQLNTNVEKLTKVVEENAKSNSNRGN